jgi:hypothetical protein
LARAAPVSWAQARDGAEPLLPVGTDIGGVRLEDVFRNGQFPAHVFRAAMLLACRDEVGELLIPFASVPEAEDHVRILTDRNADH